jgi:hypothetical protein
VTFGERAAPPGTSFHGWPRCEIRVEVVFQHEPPPHVFSSRGPSIQVDTTCKEFQIPISILRCVCRFLLNRLLKRGCVKWILDPRGRDDPWLFEHYPLGYRKCSGKTVLARLLIPFSCVAEGLTRADATVQGRENEHFE